MRHHMRKSELGTLKHTSYTKHLRPCLEDLLIFSTESFASNKSFKWTITKLVKTQPSFSSHQEKHNKTVQSQHDNKRHSTGHDDSNSHKQSRYTCHSAVRFCGAAGFWSIIRRFFGGGKVASKRSVLLKELISFSRSSQNELPLKFRMFLKVAVQIWENAWFNHLWYLFRKIRTNRRSTKSKLKQGESWIKMLGDVWDVCDVWGLIIPI